MHHGPAVTRNSSFLLSTCEHFPISSRAALLSICEHSPISSRFEMQEVSPNFAEGSLLLRYRKASLVPRLFGLPLALLAAAAAAAATAAAVVPVVESKRDSPETSNCALGSKSLRLGTHELGLLAALLVESIVESIVESEESHPTPASAE